MSIIESNYFTMDIKEAINNIIHKHNEVKKPLKTKDESNNDSDQNYIKKEESQEDLYKSFEDNFHHIVDDVPPNYWRSNFQKKIKKIEAVSSKVDKKSKFYLHYGMRVNLSKKTEEALAIIGLMNIIRKVHTKNDIFDKMADIKILEEKIKKGKVTGLLSMIKNISSSDSGGGSSSDKELEKEIEVKDSGDERGASEHLRLEEVYIQAVAVSLLAESDGDCAIAKKILHNGGMEAIKKMDISFLKTTLDQLNEVVITEHEL